jgi:uncharacterized protein (DUF1015 family)
VYDQHRVDLARVVAPPYDVITPEDRVRYYAQDPHNVVRLIAGVVQDSDHPADNKYTRAAAFFQQWLREGILRSEPGPGFYVYRQSFPDPESGRPRARTGMLAVVHLEALGKTVLAHERTHLRPRVDQQSLTQAVDANLSPVFALYQNPGPALPELLDRAASGRAWFSIEAEGEGHTVWRVADPRDFRIMAAALADSRLFIADGHHRYETAWKYQNGQLAAHPEASPRAAFNYVLMLLADSDDPSLRILPTHRLIHAVPDLDGPSLLARLRKQFTLTPASSAAATLEAPAAGRGAHRVGVVLPGPAFFLLQIPRLATDRPLDSLDVVALHRDVIGPEIGLREGQLEDERHITYTRDAGFAVEQVRSGRAQAAFLLQPPQVADVLAVAASGAVMPQKSTYFYPKPASGIVFNPLAPGIEIPEV